MSAGLVLSRELVREVERRAIDELGLPALVLMENAGRGAAEIALAMLRERAAGGAVLVLCGPGSNGGDGYVLARHLAERGVPVACGAVGARPGPESDAGVMRAVAERLGLVLELADAREGMARGPAPALVVDALLGTGFQGGPVREPVRGAIEWALALRARGAAVLALDVPSGLDCDGLRPGVPTVVADRTATFLALKPGLARGAGGGAAAGAGDPAGRVEVLSIGIPASFVERVAAGRAGRDGRPG